MERTLPFADDPENLSVDHLRNRVRRQLIPLLERDYQTEVRRTLTRTARNMADLADVLESAASTLPIDRSDSGLRAPLGRLAATDEIVRRQVFRRMLTAVRPPTPPTEQEVRRVEATFMGGPPSEFADTDAYCRVDGAWLLIGVDAPADVPAAAEVDLVDALTWGAFTFRVGRADRAIRLSPWQFWTHERPLRVRPARNGDLISIRDGSKSVNQAIRERDLHPETHPVVVDEDGRVVWIPGVRHAWCPAPESDPHRYLVIVVDQDSPWAPFEP